MTREQLIQRMPAIQAWIDGKPIEGKFNHKQDNWEVIATSYVPDFLNDKIDWRIKPEPGRWWLKIGSYNHVEDGFTFNRNDKDGIVEVVEVLK